MKGRVCRRSNGREDATGGNSGDRTILFDFGNVIAFFDHQRAIRRLLPLSKLTLPREMVKVMYDNNLEYRYECGEVTTMRCTPWPAIGPA